MSPALTAWLADAHPDLAGGPLTASVIAGGRSNLTYAVDGARMPLILRRPPLGHVLSSAHDMRREHRVISALAGSAVPVPRRDRRRRRHRRRRVTGTVFFVMERAPGEVLARPRAERRRTRPQDCASLSVELVEHLADLHAVDPAAVGLGGLRSPRRLPRAAALDVAAAAGRVALARDAGARRAAGEPWTTGCRHPARSGIVHGDFRLDNALVVGEAR